MTPTNQFSSSLQKLRQAYALESKLPDLNVSFHDYLSQVEVHGRGPAEKPSFSLEAKRAVSVLREAVLFGDLLSAISRNELLVRAETGEEEARVALKKLFGCRAIYPGTFDPFTLGHCDVARRAVDLFDQVVIGIGVNPGKSPLFSTEERIALIEADLKDLGDKIQVEVFEGSLVSFARKLNCGVVLRGIRSVTDYEQELQLALLNQTLSKGAVETLFIPAKEGSSFVSSSVVKSVIKVDEDASSMVSPLVLAALQAKRREGKL